MKHILHGLFFVVFFSFAIGYVTIPDPAYATQGIVPCGDAGDARAECSLCDLQILAVNFVKFMIMFATLVATLLFVNAGILYVFSPANPGNIAKAHGIFRSTLVGFIIILASWLIISIIMSTLYKESAFGTWTNILCDGDGTGSVSQNENVAGQPLSVNSNSTNQNTPVDPTSQTLADAVNGGDGDVGSGSVDLHDEQALKDLFDDDFGFSETAPGMTTFAGIQQSTVDGAFNFSEVSGLGKTDLIISGAVDSASPAHTDGALSHGNGYKLDFKNTPALTSYIENNFTPDGVRQGEYGGPQYTTTINGQKVEAVNEGNIWDFTFFPTS
jgi:hypothetical protein